MYLPTRDNDAASLASSLTGSTSSVADKTHTLAAALRTMTPAEAQSMTTDIYTTLSELFRRLSTHQKLLLDITSRQMEKGDAPIDVSDLLLGVIKSSEARMTKIIRVRQRQTASLAPQAFLDFYTLNGIYFSEVETICGDPSESLRACITGIIREFLSTLHQKYDQELASLMDKDPWKDEEISAEFQATVDVLVKGAECDPDEWLLSRLTVVLGDRAQASNGSVSSLFLTFYQRHLVHY
jgi:vacuolar protein sorting-associated protein 54